MIFSDQDLDGHHIAGPLPWRRFFSMPPMLPVYECGRGA